ncbi:histone-lysine N-methyltransferase SUVR4-like [Salvia miltiorrhiza]|uniref:histone-lysine N-methyltransferase SUVR4-like n=1 Tax=Salvia miltiorrhiza TaxID=226208 RepID=UPI0025AC1BC7|nr:histone-lysine N-methyltransferase SUVR4-like [Salvia miltiorrhiza]XP_057802327.1 histone-lysine N-methyltransferase SUVR4-like [Salvia miltiorrhiza]
MATVEKVRRAYNAMKSLGISEENVKPVLKRLLKLYNKNWQLIEEDNYRTLADAIFEYEDDKNAEGEMEPALKKQQRGNGEDKVLSKDKGKRVVCEEELDDPDSRDNGNAVVPWEGQPIDHSSQAHSSHICTGSVNPSRDEATVVAKSEPKMVFNTIEDITKGSEKVKISLVDETGNEDLPHFLYFRDNVTYEAAYVHVSLARIADEDCCSDCRGDCLSPSIPCECAGSTGGEYAYTKEGLLTQDFLKTCLSAESLDMKHAVYCKDCPLERAKNADLPGKCKGHISKKFIKECWRKCGCDMRCGNRVVQRGITRKLQVFVTSENKGWGVRAFEELPQGAFVCEYVGEILTNMELYDRNTQSGADKERHAYPVLLDADWSTEENLKDEEALCLDATKCGNVARFINHRCADANLIDIPVQVETPDRHYYHVAFFTRRKVEALEELTWDYGIDFSDTGHPIKAFRCRCGSKFCRDIKRRR